MLSMIDGFFRKLCGYPLRLLCATTGKDNFFWTKVALWMGAPILLFFVLALSASGGTSNIVIGLLGGVAFSGMFLGALDAVSEVQESIEEGAEALPGQAVDDIVSYRLTLIGLMFLMLLLILALGRWSALLIYPLIPFPYWTVGLYWATEFRPRRPSKAKQALRWFRARASLPSVGKPVPQPIRG